MVCLQSFWPCVKGSSFSPRVLSHCNSALRRTPVQVASTSTPRFTTLSCVDTVLSKQTARLENKTTKPPFSPPHRTFVLDPFRDLVHSTTPNSKTNARANSWASEQLEGRRERLLHSNHHSCVTPSTARPVRPGLSLCRSLTHR